MGLSVIPTNIGGVNIPLAQLQGPLSSLFQTTASTNLTFPADLATNPTMGHAVIFSVYDYQSGFSDGLNQATSALSSAINNVASGTTNLGQAINSASQAVSAGIQSNISAALNGDKPSVINAIQAKTYTRTANKKAPALGNICLYMPDTLVAQHTANYSDVSMTDLLGYKGLLGNAYGDFAKAGGMKSVADFANTFLKSDYGKAAAAKVAGAALGGGELGAVIQQAAGQYTNPQTQLLFKGVGLRTFNLEFLFTPKSSAEADTVKTICDTFTFFSLPGLAGASGGEPGQYLTPPQIFGIQFKFLGGNGIVSSVANVFQNALTNAGLGFLTSTNPYETINGGADAKIMSINDCVLESVSVDYAPNGWAAYNDGYGVQTRLTLSFKEMRIFTKDDVKNPTINKNYKSTTGSSTTSNPNALPSLSGVGPQPGVTY